MLIKTTSLQVHLQHPLLPVYVICGSDDYFLNESKRYITRTWRQQALQQTDADSLEKQSFEIGRDGQTWESLRYHLQSFSLFAEKTLYQIAYHKSALEKNAQRLLIDFAESNSTHATVILTGNQLKQKSLSTVEKHERIGLIPVWPLKQHEFVRWVDQQLRRVFTQVPPASDQLIARFCQNNPYAVRQIIAKLKLTQPKSSPLTEEVISQQLSNQCEFQIFELSDACLEGNFKKVMQILAYLRHNPNELNLLLWGVSKEIRSLLQLHSISQTKPITQACQQLGIWRSKMSLYQSAIKRLNTSILNQLLWACHDADKSIKTGKSLIARQTIEQVALSLATGKEIIVHG